MTPTSLFLRCGCCTRLSGGFLIQQGWLCQRTAVGMDVVMIILVDCICTLFATCVCVCVLLCCCVWCEAKMLARRRLQYIYLHSSALRSDVCRYFLWTDLWIAVSGDLFHICPAHTHVPPARLCLYYQEVMVNNCSSVPD